MSNETEVQDAEVTGTNPGSAIAKSDSPPQALQRSFTPAEMQRVSHEDSGSEARLFTAVPYVGFLGKKSEKNVEAIKAVGVQVNDFYLAAGAAGFVKVKPMAIHVLGRLFTAFVQTDEDGKLLSAAMTYDRDRDNQGFDEKVLAVVAVAIPATEPGKPSNFVAATLELKGAQAKALKKSRDLLGTEKAKGVACFPEKWAAFGAAHKTASASIYPGGRFRAEIWSAPQTPIGGGRPYNLGDSRTYPTPEVDVKAFDAWVESDWSSIEAAMRQSDRRAQDIKKKAQEAGLA